MVGSGWWDGGVVAVWIGGGGGDVMAMVVAVAMAWVQIRNIYGGSEWTFSHTFYS